MYVLFLEASSILFPLYFLYFYLVIFYSYRPQEQEELYKKVICKFESNNQALIQENTNLRDIFYKLHTNLGLLAQRFAEFMVSYYLLIRI